LIFRRRWLFAGHSSQIARPGQFFTFELEADSVIVSRAVDDRIAAFHNVCRHRGTRLSQARSGQVKTFRCPFHGWGYGLDGRLMTAPLMGPGFDRSQFSAKPVWAEEWNGLIFINLSTDEPERSVGEFLAKTDLSRYRLGDTKVVAERIYELECNWKIAAETFNECYHCQLNHPTLCTVINPSSFADAFDDSSKHDDVYDGDFLLYTDDRAGGEKRETAANGVMKPGILSYTTTGRYASKRLLGSVEQPANKHGGMSWFPQFGLHLSLDYANTWSWVPVSPTRSRMRSTWMVHAEAREGIDYTVDDVVAFMHVTNLEDEELCRIAQEGINSTAYQNSAPYHRGLEGTVRRFMRTYLDHVGRISDAYDEA
jgi:Rieske 2Fe-2S family protein